MSSTHLFEIGYKAGMTDPAGQGLKNDIVHLGLARNAEVSSAQLYKVSGTLSAEQRARVAKDLLCDPILNECRTVSTSSSSKETDASEPKPGKHTMVIDVWYKAGVTDVIGDSVRKGIEDLDIHSVQDVRTGMRYHLKSVTKREVADKIALALLVNPLVHEYKINAD